MGYGAGTDSWPEDNRTDWSLESIYQLLVYSTMYYKGTCPEFTLSCSLHGFDIACCSDLYDDV